MISLIVAKTKNNVIGYRNKMPWHLPADLKHFKAITMGKSIIMGRKTAESIGHILPGRRNIIISHQTNLHIKGAEIFFSLDAAFHALRSEKEIMIIGGASIFSQVLHRADCLYVTQIETKLKGDTFFPVLSPHEWTLISEKKYLADEKNNCAYSFQTFVRFVS